MTFEQAFLKIKEKFENADASGTDDFAIQVTFTDEDCGGTFYAEVKDGKLAVEPYDYWDNTASLDISKSALLAILGGRSTLDKAVADGEAFVHGDASKIADWKKTIKKAPAKKTVAKKPGTKKTAKSAPAKTEAKAVSAKSANSEAKTVPAKSVKSEVKTASAKSVKPEAKTAPVKPAAKKTTKK